MSLSQQLSASGLMAQGHGVDLYVLMETSSQQELQARMAFHDVVHRSLWREEGMHGMETYAPWVAQVGPGSSFDQWIGDALPGLAVTLVSSSLSFDMLWRHLRRFAKFEAEGRQYLLRLGDPASLHLYATSLAEKPDAVARFFAHGDLQYYYFHDPRTGLARWMRPVFESDANGQEREGCLIWRDMLLEVT